MLFHYLKRCPLLLSTTYSHENGCMTDNTSIFRDDRDKYEIHLVVIAVLAISLVLHLLLGS
jgi:hypothetical protein